MRSVARFTGRDVVGRSSCSSVAAFLRACVFNESRWHQVLQFPHLATCCIRTALLRRTGSQVLRSKPGMGWFSQTKPKPKQMGQVGLIMA